MTSLHLKGHPSPFSSTSSSNLFAQMFFHTRQTIKKQSDFFMEDHEQKMKEPYCAILFQKMKQIQLRNDFTQQTLCAAMHYYQYILTVKKNEIEDGQEEKYAETCMMCSAMIFQSLEKVNRLQIGDSGNNNKRRQKLLKWMNFRLNLATFINVIEVVKQTLRSRKPNCVQLFKNIDILVKKQINSLKFLYKNPQKVGFQIIKQALFNLKENVRFCPFPQLLTVQQWDSVDYEIQKGEKMKESNFLMRKVNFGSSFNPFEKVEKKQFFSPCITFQK